MLFSFSRVLSTTCNLLQCRRFLYHPLYFIYILKSLSIRLISRSKLQLLLDFSSSLVSRRLSILIRFRYSTRLHRTEKMNAKVAISKNFCIDVRPRSLLPFLSSSSSLSSSLSVSLSLFHVTGSAHGETADWYS